MNFEFWMVDCAEGAVAVLLRASRLRQDESSYALRDSGRMSPPSRFATTA
ncbi:MAG: hypothetical protein WCG52_11275 [bacterium]